jgi:Tol biopolymer transport system component
VGRTWVFGAIAAAVLAIATPAVAASNGRVALWASTGLGGRADIATLKSDGKGWRVLTPGDHEAYCAPSWSPDGARIAFVEPNPDAPQPTDVQSGRLHVMNADGTGDRVLALAQPAPDCVKPSWSPDGAYIAYQGFQGTNWRDVYVIRSSGLGAPTLASDDDSPSFSPAWSPDGSKILFGNDDAYLYTTSVAFGPLGPSFGSPQPVAFGWIGTEPDWSPGGTRLAVGRYDSEELRGLWTIDSGDGGNAQRVTAGHDTSPSWSSDGARIAFTRQLDGLPHLFHTAADGTGEPVQVTQPRDGYVWFSQPDWQPR